MMLLKTGLRTVLVALLSATCLGNSSWPKPRDRFNGGPSMFGARRPLEYRHDPQHQLHRRQVLEQALERYGDISSSSTSSASLRAGNMEQVSAAARAMTTLIRITFELVTSACQIVIPPLCAATKTVYLFYKTLPIDLILAQIGLVYCFSGGYFPTLFAACQAAQHAGLPVMLAAMGDLIDEGFGAVDAIHERNRETRYAMTPRQALQQSTAVVLATVDPIKINHATAALYTSWLGISVVLEKEFAKTINMSLTISQNILPVVSRVLHPPMYFVVPDDYHRWVPVVSGWACKAAAMSVAWRIQRIITACTSSMAGGLMFSRAVLRMLLNQRDHERHLLDEALGFAVAGVGLYSQIGHGISFNIPFPLSLVTWPFEIAERWIQWQITKEAKV